MFPSRSFEFEIRGSGFLGIGRGGLLHRTVIGAGAPR